MGTEDEMIPAQVCPAAPEPWTRRQLCLAAAIAATCAAAGFGVVHAIGSRIISHTSG